MTDDGNGSDESPLSDVDRAKDEDIVARQLLAASEGGI